MPPPAPQLKVKIQIPTDKIITSIVQMYGTDEKELKKSALELAGYVLESYTDHNQMKKDIFGTFVTQKNLMIAMQKEVQRRFPAEAEILRQVFGEFLFGG